MELFFIALTIIGLILFEAVSSFDNAVINAEILRKMSPWARRWFLIWGLFIAVFLLRGLLPLLIVFISNPSLGIVGAFTATFSDDPEVAHTIEKSAPILLVGGGVFLIFVFFHWLFLETKNFGLKGEKFMARQGVWFYAVVSILLAIITWEALKVEPLMAFSAVVGSTAFFITHGFRQNAELKEKEMIEGKSNMSDWSKILYLEVIDASFSIDGVIGAFAFTMSVPLILVGNGIGAFIVREMTIRNIENVQKYKYLKNGAMYSILVLGTVMVLDAFAFHIPIWFSPISTIAIIGYFFRKSLKEIGTPSGQHLNH
ncbi:DUF475 domain-containing protein [Candidatus Micrarchaeota archaeon]|nr:DUF475 domain-containing protein [Candidatus Micrarchaeota archaeon]